MDDPDLATIYETLPRDESTYYETVIALCLEILDRLEPIFLRAVDEDEDEILFAADAANYIRQRTIIRREKRRQEVVEGRRQQRRAMSNYER